MRDLILNLNPELKADDVTSRSMGAQGEDILLSPAAREWVPFQIECKNRDRISVYAWYMQADEHGGHKSLLVIKEDHKDPLVVIDAIEFFELLRKVKQLDNIQHSTP